QCSGVVVAQFLQHNSRDRGPQLHVHQAILNQVRQINDILANRMDVTALIREFIRSSMPSQNSSKRL
ncbi:MAG: relaxase domain-containing protein, partial [Actinobacteria bacterium]|nr:relaxase domain-containing protein [Actinomycetota bacterium]